jgi:hypothetical protein
MKQNQSACYPDVFDRYSKMIGNEFVRKVKALGKLRDISVSLNASRGKGSHQTLCWQRIYGCAQPQGRTQDRHLSRHVQSAWYQTY